MKKKHFIGLSTLLLVLLLGLYTTSYALTETGFKNLIYNYATNQLEYTDSQAKEYVNTLYTAFDGYYNYMTDNYYWFVCLDGTYLKFWVEPVANYGTSNTKKTTIIPGSTTENFSPVSYDGIYFSYNTSGGRFSTNSGRSMNHVSVSSNLYFTEQDLYNTSYNTILNQAPYSRPSWFTSSGAYDINFDYVYNPNLQNVTVEEIPYNNGQMKAITYSGVNNRTYLCVFGDYYLLDHVYMDYYKYNTYLGEWTHYYTVEPYRDFEVEDNQIRLYFSGNYIANTICMLGFIPKSR